MWWPSLCWRSPLMWVQCEDAGLQGWWPNPGCWGRLSLQCLQSPVDSPVRYVSIIQSNIESGPKMIQFNIQFKTKFEIFIQSKIHSKISLKYSIQNFIQEIGKKWFKMSTWYKCSRKGKKLPSPSNWLFHCCHVNPYLGTRGTLITM